jgi:hypothetical protein
MTMKKLNFLKFGFTVMVILFLYSFSAITYSASKPKQQYYEIRIYHVKQSSQSERIDSYLKYAFIPALHRAGIDKIGVFKPVEADTAFGKLIYVFVPLKNVDQYLKLPGQLSKDKEYQKAGNEFLDATYNDPPFARYESILLKAFKDMPQFRAPVYNTPVGDRIYELRSYESATEAKASKKIYMFNQGGEIKLFESLNFNAVFYGEVLMGSHKPNLMYMITFKDMATHDAKWKEFSGSPEWKKLSGLEEYKNTVSKANMYLLHPVSYSDF